MKKYISIGLVLLLLLTLLPMTTGASMVLYDLEKDTFAPTLAEADSVTFTAPGDGTIVIPEATLKASEGDGFLVSILKEQGVVCSATVNGDEALVLPEQTLTVQKGNKIIFKADARARDGELLFWHPTLSYQGGIAEAEALVNFVDLNNHWAKNYVLPLAEEGIIKGKTVNRFDPDGQITRAEFLTLALKVANLPAEIYEPSYADISENQWFAKTAYAAYRGALVDQNMLPDGKLLPDQPITREEMTSVIMRVMDVMRGKQVDATHNFSDGASFSPWASESIGKAANLGIVTGNPDGSFNARGNATRGEAAVIFSRLKKILDESAPYTPAGEYSPVYGGIVREDVDVNKIINDA
ncbi:MAG: S-layer homology domain-containing protein, partial [Clostridia bacterium]|nr:S-layer homology domain-containing protein [Clostridia bacterium]